MAIAEIIKYEGDNTTFVWKSPQEDFNTKTQLIVHESQEAIFFANGQALDLFGPGRHTLSTENIPFLKKFFNIPTGGETPFHCEVYFINKTEQMAIKWGTDSKVQYMDPVYKFPLTVGVSGEMTLRVCDSRKLLINVVGTEKVLTQSQITTNFKSFLMARIKPYIAQSMMDREINIFEVDAQMTEFSEDLHQRLIPDFDSYGLELVRFFVTNIVKPEGEKQYEYFKDLHFRQYADIRDAQIRQQTAAINQETEAIKTRIDFNVNAEKTRVEAGAMADKQRIEAEANAYQRKVEGYDYKTERAYDVAENVANNEGVGNFANAGMGLGMMGGMGFGVGAVVADVTKDALSPVLGGVSNAGTVQQGGGISAPPLVDLKGESPTSVPNETRSASSAVCPFCGAVLKRADAKFCTSCGRKLDTPAAAYCSECGAEMMPDEKFCPECGHQKED